MVCNYCDRETVKNKTEQWLKVQTFRFKNGDLDNKVVIFTLYFCSVACLRNYYKNVIG